MEAVEPRCRGLGFATFEIDLKLHEVRKRGVPIRLTGHAYQALLLLLERPGEIVTREEFQKALWPTEPWGDHEHGLNKVINRVREALHDSADNPRFLATVPRVGYRFLVPVERRLELEPPSTYPNLEVPPATPELVPIRPATPVALPGPARAWLGFPFLAISAAVLTIGVVLGLAFRGRASGPESSAQPAESVPLTSYVGSELAPACSPDGESVAFMWNGEADSVFHIYLTTLSRTGPRRMTNSSRSDYAPIWSPDGDRIAFVRAGSGTQGEVLVMNKDGSGERRIATLDFADLQHPLTWSRDPQWLIVSAQVQGDGPAALYLLSTESGEKRRLTSPSVQSSGDWSPAVSPDGSLLAFTRPSNSAWRDIFLVPLSVDLVPTEEPTQVTNLHRVIDTVAWGPDGTQVFFSAAASLAGARFLYKVSARPKTATAPQEVGVEGIYPAISPKAGLLIYSHQNIEQTSIWRLRANTPQGDKLPHTDRLLSSTRRDFTADLSPDGKRLVFSSARTGLTDIWMSNVDGSNIERLTSFGASTPRWSPDGRRIVFESTIDGQSEVYVFDLENRKLQRLTFDPSPDVRPSWSRNGQYIYFSSKRTGKFQLWRVPSCGGAPVQVTRSGAVYGVESSDGKLLYYLTADQPARIVQLSLASGAQQELVGNAIGYASLALGRSGLYFLSSITPTSSTLAMYDFAAHKCRRVLVMNRPVHHFLSSPPSGDFVLYTQIDRQESDLMWRPLSR